MPKHCGHGIVQCNPAVAQGRGLHGQRRPVGPAGRGLPALQFQPDQIRERGVGAVGAASQPGSKLLNLITA